MTKSHPPFAESPFHPEGFRRDILAWYRIHHRHLPWRAAEGDVPNPYHVWLSEIMLQQTTVAAVIPYFLRFIRQWPRVQDLASAEDADVMTAWAGLGYYARARNLLKCARQVCHLWNGQFPGQPEHLRTLPGVGPYTAAAIAAIAFSRPSVVVDGNVERVSARVFCLETPLPQGKADIVRHASRLYEGTKADEASLFPQALMDLGAMVCTPRNPDCPACPVRGHCRGVAAGLAPHLPFRSPRMPKPQRHGKVFWVETEEGNVLLEKRAEDRMLGGMIGIPTSSWDRPGLVEESEESFHALPMNKKSTIRHSFTHFDLTLDIWCAHCREERLFLRKNQFLLGYSEACSLAMPSLFRKVVRAVVRGAQG